MNAPDSTAVLERQLLLQLGDRLKRLRKSQGLGTVEMAKRAGISRTTLGSVEAGDPGPSIGTYLRVMSLLGVSGELALLAGDALQPAPAGSAAARSRRARPIVQVTVSTDESLHQVQDLQSLALHEEAVRLVRADPALLLQAQATLERWLGTGSSRSSGLWHEWQEILRQGKWRKVLGRTRRAQELRQASPLPAVLPRRVRQACCHEVGQSRKNSCSATPRSNAAGITGRNSSTSTARSADVTDQYEFIIVAVNRSSAPYRIRRRSPRCLPKRTSIDFRRLSRRESGAIGEGRSSTRPWLLRARCGPQHCSAPARLDEALAPGPDRSHRPPCRLLP